MEKNEKTGSLARDLLICLAFGVLAALVAGGVGALIGSFAYKKIALPYAAPLFGAVVALLLAGALVMLVSVFTSVRQAHKRSKKRARPGKVKQKAPEEPAEDAPAAPARRVGLTRLAPQVAMISVGAFLVVLGFVIDLICRL